MNRSAMQIRCRQNDSFINSTITIADPALQAAVEHFGEGDRVVLEYKTENGKNILQNLSVKAQELDWGSRIVALIISCIVLLFIFWLLLQDGLQNLIIGTDNRYSNSKTQIVLWFFILIITYIASIVLRGWYGGIDFVGGVSIPQNLLLLSGLSALTFVTAKGITQSKVESRVIKKEQPKEGPKFPNDLFLDDEQRVDLGDFQMIIITLLAVFVYLAKVLGFLGTIEFHQAVTLPDVDTTILATFGLGQGAYLAKKFLGDAGGGNPVNLYARTVKTNPHPNIPEPTTPQPPNPQSEPANQPVTRSTPASSIDDEPNPIPNSTTATSSPDLQRESSTEGKIDSPS